MSGRESVSSSRTGASTHMEVEGTWDEDIPLDQIHNSIIEYLTDKLEKLRLRYTQAKTDKKDHVMGKIVKYRMAYQKYVHITRDILQKCEEFLKDRKDSPGSRVAYIKNVQQYISQAKEFVKLDLKFKKLSPSLLSHLEPQLSDTPEIFQKKRYIRNTISSILNNEKITCLTSTGAGKSYRLKHNNQSQFLTRGFNSSWTKHLPPDMSSIISSLESDDERWAAMIVFLLSRKCSRMYIHNGFCPSCLFPIIIPRETKEGGSGTIYCPSCFKEITWTYFISRQSMNQIFSQFHPDELLNLMNKVRGGEDGDDFFEGYANDLYNKCLHNISISESDRSDSSPRNIPVVCLPSSSSHQSPSQPSSSVQIKDTIPIKVTSYRFEPETLNFKDIFRIVSERLKKISGYENYVIDRKNVKESFDQFTTEIYNIEGGCIIKVPRGFFPSLKRYMNFYHSSDTSITRKMIYDALVSLGYDEYTKHISYISHKLYNTPYPDFSSKRSVIVIECIIIKILFGICVGKGTRRVHVNNYYIIHIVLGKNGYDLSDDHFRISENTKKKKETVMKDICNLIYTQEAPDPSTSHPHQ